MEVIHNLGALSINNNVNENAGFLLTNKKGSYCSFFNEPSSRYNGLFYFDDREMLMYKFIDSIELASGNNVERLKNGFYFAERKKENAIEMFLMPKNFNSLIYELGSENEIDLLLDCKGSYDNREWGRHYSISEEEGCIIVKFTKNTDAREDAKNGLEEYALYLAAKSSSNAYEKNGKWVERHYPYDEERNSQPFKRHVYNALRLKGSKFVFSMSKSRHDAVTECGHIFSNMQEIKNREKEHFFSMLKNESVRRVIANKKIGKEIKVAYVNALNSLNNLIVDSRDNYGVIAGLPWFFQFWARDSLVSLKSISKINEKIAKKMLFRYLNKINSEGRLPNLSGKNIPVQLGNADSHGWLFFRCSELIDKISRNKEIINAIKRSMAVLRQGKSHGSVRVRECLKNCNSIIRKKENEYHHAVYEIESSLEKSLHGLLKFHTKDSFEVNSGKETWMDTDFGNDSRNGIRIEVQALRLNMYRLMFELTQNPKYKALENILKIKVREKFWNGKTLADGLNDSTIRPNVFIAAYAYPELLSNREWEACLGNALKSLWLGWGGMSTIDKKNPLFTAVSTGENPKSYHRGDSWFWLNNLAAIVLSRTNKGKFKKFIEKLIDASTEEILWKGCVGCHSELSPASELSSRGCFNQAWSNAMYMEMVEECF